MIYQICNGIRRAWNKLIVSPVKKSALGKCGKNVKLGGGAPVRGEKYTYRERREYRRWLLIYVY